MVCRAGPFVVMSWDFYRGNVLLLWVLRIVDVILGRDLVLKADISALYHEGVNDEVKDGPQDSSLVAQSLHQGPIQVQEFGRGIWTSSATSITVSFNLPWDLGMSSSLSTLVAKAAKLNGAPSAGAPPPVSCLVF